MLREQLLRLTRDAPAAPEPEITGSDKTWVEKGQRPELMWSPMLGPRRQLPWGWGRGKGERGMGVLHHFGVGDVLLRATHKACRDMAAEGTT